MKLVYGITGAVFAASFMTAMVMVFTIALTTEVAIMVAAFLISMISMAVMVVAAVYELNGIYPRLRAFENDNRALVGLTDVLLIRFASIVFILHRASAMGQAEMAHECQQTGIYSIKSMLLIAEFARTSPDSLTAALRGLPEKKALHRLVEGGAVKKLSSDQIAAISAFIRIGKVRTK